MNELSLSKLLTSKKKKETKNCTLLITSDLNHGKTAESTTQLSQDYYKNLRTPSNAVHK